MVNEMKKIKDELNLQCVENTYLKLGFFIKWPPFDFLVVKSN